MLTLLAALAAASPCPGLPDAWAAIARTSPGRVGAAAVCLETGQASSLRGAEAFPAQSVYKLPIAMAALQVAGRNGWQLDRPIRVLRTDVVAGPYPSPTRAAWRAGKPDVPLRDLVHHTFAVSDNTSSDVLLRLAGGPAAVNAYVAGLGIGGVRVATPLAAFAPARNTVTPDAAVRLLGAAWRGQGVGPEGRALLLAAMAACETGPGRLKAGVPAGTPLAHKTGGTGTFGGATYATNDVGIITLPDGRHLAIAAFVAEAKAPEAACERTIAQLARAAWRCWTAPR